MANKKHKDEAKPFTLDDMETMRMVQKGQVRYIGENTQGQSCYVFCQVLAYRGSLH